MRKSTRILNPMFVVTSYYLLLALAAVAILSGFPGLVEHLPFGGVDLLSMQDDDEVITTIVHPPAIHYGKAITLVFAIVGAVFVTVPVTWVYFITTRTKQVNRSLAQTIMVLPVVVAGIAMIVQNSLPLAFSLAGVVAIVRFRFSLAQPAHALYIFVAIAIGLGAGIGALEVSSVTSIGFVYVNLLLWKLDYGQDLTSPFFAFLTGRGRDDNEL